MKSEHTANNQLASTDHKTLALIKKGCCYMPIHRQVKAASIMA